jgi:hypothetical protein
MIIKAGVAVKSLVVCSILSAASFALRAGAQSAQAVQSQRPTRNTTAVPRPLTIEHLYWHFLMFQNHLDAKATDVEAHGKDGRMMRRYLQQRAGLNDSDYSEIRKSSTRLAGEIAALDAQAVTIRAAGRTLSSVSQLNALTSQREANITAEVTSIRQKMMPDTNRAFEQFLTQFFSPSNAVPIPHPSSKASTVAVQP